MFSSSRRRRIRTTRVHYYYIDKWFYCYIFLLHSCLNEVSRAHFPFIPSQRRKSESEHEKSEEKIDEKKQKHCENVDEWEYSLPFNLKLNRVDNMFIKNEYFTWLPCYLATLFSRCSTNRSTNKIFFNFVPVILKLEVVSQALPFSYLYLFVPFHFP